MKRAWICLAIFPLTACKQSASTAEPATAAQEDAPKGADVMSAFAVAPSGSLTLAALNSGKCMNVEGASSANGAALIQWDCGKPPAANEIFSFVSAGSSGGSPVYLIKAKSSDKCVEPSNASSQDGALLVQNTCSTSRAVQKWSLKTISSNRVQISNTATKKCVNVPGMSSTSGTRLHQWTCGSTAASNETWTFAPLGQIPSPTATPVATPTATPIPTPTPAPTITVSPGADIQATIDRAASGSRVYFNAGTYNISNVLRLKSGITLEGAPGAILRASAPIGLFSGLGVRDVTIKGLILDGGTQGGPGYVSGAIYLDTNGTTPSQNIRIVGNTFQNWTNSSALWLWLTQSTFVQKNLFKDSWQGVSWRTNPDAPALDMLVISDNTFTKIARMGVETGFHSKTTNVHIDRNKMSLIGGFDDPNWVVGIALSIIGRIESGTIYGNEITDQFWAIEIGNGFAAPYNVTVANNVMTRCTWGISVSHSPGSVNEGNSFNGVTSPFSEDGGYDNSTWIGVNIYDGVSRNAWVGPGSKPHGPYGIKPATFQPAPAPSTAP